MAPQVLHNNRVKFPKDILLHCSVHQHGRRDVRCKPSIGFYGEGKTGEHGEKPLGAEYRTNKPTYGIEPGTHWWQASAITTAPPLLPCHNRCHGQRLSSSSIGNLSTCVFETRTATGSELFSLLTCLHTTTLTLLSIFFSIRDDYR